MAAITIRQPLERGYRNDGIGIPAVRHYPEASGETWTRGAFVYIDTNGDMAECGADPATIAGWALSDAAEVAGTDQEVLLAKNTVHMVLNTQLAITLLQAFEGQDFGITKTGNFWHLDTTKTGGTARMTVEKTYPQDVVGTDTAGRVTATVLQTNQQFPD